MTDETAVVIPPAMTDILPLPEDPGDLPQPAPFYYVAAANGPMAMKSTMFGNALVPVDEIPHLPKRGPVLWTKIPKVPARLINQVWSFFAEVWRVHKTEAMVYLTYKNGEYRVFVPDQHPTGGHVNVENFDATKLQRGWRLAGTIHSHCNFGGFHSGTDKADAEKHDGIHMTFGHVDDPRKFEIASMISINKILWDFKPEDVIEGDIGQGTHPKWWETHIKERRPATWGNQPPIGTVTRITGGDRELLDGEYHGRYSGLSVYRGGTNHVDTVHSHRADPNRKTLQDPYADSTPIHHVETDEGVGLVDVLIRRNWFLKDPLTGDIFTDDEWMDEVSQLDTNLQALASYYEDLGIIVNFTFKAHFKDLFRYASGKKKQKGGHK